MQGGGRCCSAWPSFDAAGCPRPGASWPRSLAGHWLANLRFHLALRSCAREGAEQEEGAIPPEDTAYPLAGVFVTGLLYLPVSLSFLTRMKAIEVVLVLLAVIAADVGAYYAGSLLGGPKVWPAVSPKKTWAGSLGGHGRTHPALSGHGRGGRFHGWAGRARAGPGGCGCCSARPSYLAAHSGTSSIPRSSAAWGIQGLGRAPARPRRNHRPHRQPAPGRARVRGPGNPVLLLRPLSHVANFASTCGKRILPPIPRERPASP
jgi:hypothetical protein